jgi:hypothetical protein
MGLTIFRAGPNWVHFSTTSKKPIQYRSAIARRNDLEAALRSLAFVEGKRKSVKVQGQPVNEDQLIVLLRTLDANWQPTLF